MIVNYFKNFSHYSFAICINECMKLFENIKDLSFLY